MTEQLYLKDSYIFASESEILEIIRDKNSYLLVFEKTPFFPGGGGQPSDKGNVNGIAVSEAFEKDGVVYHRISEDNCSFAVGNTVSLQVDSEIRLERMRAHTGEHIVSGIAHGHFGVDNVGFHMDESALMTVDFNKYLDKAQLQIIESAANKCVMRNLYISAKYYSVSDAQKLNYRSKLEFENDVRIVEIEDTDRCACCAPHLNTTGQVGFIKILSSISHRGGVRISLITGERAYNEFEKRYSQIMKISALLCSEYDKAELAVDDIIESNKKLKYEKDQLNKKFLDYVASQIVNKDIIVEFFDGFSLDELRIISNNLKAKCRLSILFSGDDASGYGYCIMSEMIKLDRFVRDFNNSLGGRGGGRGILVQGKVAAEAKNIIEFLNEMKVEDYENA